MDESENGYWTLEEAAQRVDLSVETLRAWLEHKLIEPAVLDDERRPLLDEAGLELLLTLKGLRQLGYSEPELRKIQRKVGLPAPQTARTRRDGRLLTVGELAERSGINGRTIKYWEERGIIEPSARSEGGFRLYDKYYALLCNLIQDLQNFGYSLEQIKEIADLFRAFYAISHGSFEGTAEQTIDKLEVMLERIKVFDGRMTELTEGVERWRKLLKEKRAEIMSIRKRLRREIDRAPVAPQAVRVKS